MTQRLQFEQWVPFPLEQVFRFFANPRNLARLMPPARETRIDELILVPAQLPPGVSASGEVAGAGTEIDTSFRVLPPLPFRARWVAVITEFEWNHYFADMQRTGPFRRWHHRHEFRAESRAGDPGTAVRDVVEFEVGLGRLGGLAESLFVTRQIRQMFADRQRVLPALLGRPPA